MREIKFRAWNTIVERMSSPFSLEFLHKYEESVNFDNLIVMQFTGFKLNGTEIYEGDIISDYTQTDEGIVKSHQQVYWNDDKGAWYLDNTYKQDKSDGDLLSEMLNDFEYEILGNIHQNPELLK